MEKYLFIFFIVVMLVAGVLQYQQTNFEQELKLKELEAKPCVEQTK